MNDTINLLANNILELLKKNGVSDIQKYELLLSRIASLEQENEGLKQENEKLKEKISQLKLRREIDEGRAG